MQFSELRNGDSSHQDDDSYFEEIPERDSEKSSGYNGSIEEFSRIKQILVDTSAGEMLAKGLLSFGLMPIVAGFVLAAAVRIAQGSATVAMLTAAGLCA